LGAVAIEGDRDDERLAQLRWFITAPEARGHGLGRRLLDAAMAFCEPRFDRVYLTTMQGLDAAIHLYEDYGFELVGERPYRDWGQEITLRRYELSL
jgi:ribosomal protein S18 acetylase RimI-like enzyme